MNNGPWANLDITGESGFIELLYEPHSKSLVARFYREVGDNHHIKSLYVRSTLDQSYRRLTENSDTQSYEEAIIFPCGSYILVNVLKALREGKRYGGYNWHALQLIELPGGKVVREIKNGELNCNVDVDVDVDGDTTWVSHIHGMSQDGNTVYCTIGIPERSSSKSVKFRYHLSELDLNQRSFKMITELENPFF